MKRMPKECKLCNLWYRIMNPANLIRKCAVCRIPTHPRCAEATVVTLPDVKIFCSTCLEWFDDLIKTKGQKEEEISIEDLVEEEEEEEDESEKTVDLTKTKGQNEEEISIEESDEEEEEEESENTVEFINHAYEEIVEITNRKYPDLNKEIEEIEKKDIICNNIRRKGSCKYGKECLYKHPKVCQTYTIYGKCMFMDGYVKGKKCPDIHPKMCYRVNKANGCKHNEKCRFMHPLEMTNQKNKKNVEGKVKQQESERKTQDRDKIYDKNCIYYERGNCRYGRNCHYKHEKKQYMHDKKKTYEKACIYDKRGWCKYGDRCRYMHIYKKGENYRPRYATREEYGYESPSAPNYDVIGKLDFLLREVAEMRMRRQPTYQNQRETWENPYLECY